MANNENGRVKNIYGIYLEEGSPMYMYVKRYREDASRRIPYVAQYIEELIKTGIFKDGFYLYIHKTTMEDITPILYQGLEIRESGGGISSTLERVFDSTDSDIEGSLNYFFNSISTGNQYGNKGIIVLLPKNYEKHLEEILDKNGKYPKVKPKYIIGTFKPSCVNIGMFLFKEWINELLSGDQDTVSPN